MTVSVIGVGLLGAVATLFIRRYAPEYALLTAVVSGCVMLVLIIVSFSGLIGEMESIFSSAGLDNGILKTVLKGLGVCYLTSFATDICRDFGQTSLGAKIELAGKVTIVILTLPLIKMIIETATELIG